ncbi:MAG: methyltransferase domain-containing protein [Candidatus Parvarchaeota archaeon]
MIKEKILSSKLIWRLSGLSYRTAVIATRGSYMPKELYLYRSKNQMQQLSKYFNDTKRALEFGCGIGGNLLGVSDSIKEGVGDINPLFIRQANKLKKLAGKKNIYFISYDGKIFPTLGKFNTIFSIGVFERIPKKEVIYYLTNLNEYLDKDGVMMLYFLSERVKKTQFVKRLGENSYVYWSQSDIMDFVKQLNLEIIDKFPWYGDLQEWETTEDSHADMYIFQRL